MMRIRKARAADAHDLAQVSRDAFHSDIELGAPSSQPGGPPGYDSPRWQQQMMRRADYYVIFEENVIVGGFLVFRKAPGHYELGRIFVHPNHQRQGLGTAALQFLWKTYPFARRWTLGTPAWNRRTRAFYARMGFDEIGTEPPDGILLERRMRGHAPEAG